jgi:hypothetical protein
VSGERCSRADDVPGNSAPAGDVSGELESGHVGAEVVGAVRGEEALRAAHIAKALGGTATKGKVDKRLGDFAVTFDVLPGP